jgi:small subunit ribosomal protein S9
LPEEARTDGESKDKEPEKTEAPKPDEAAPAEKPAAAEKPDAETPAAEKPSAAPKPKAKGKKTYFWGTGRRKTSVARVRIRPGTGLFQINGKEVADYFGVERHRQQASSVLAATNTAKKVDVFVNVKGGGPSGQAGATIMGVARALAKMDGSLGPVLRSKGFLTRDARKVERKKYGRRGARRSFQFSKR